jgi:hypothetical protein
MKLKNNSNKINALPPLPILPSTAGQAIATGIPISQIESTTIAVIEQENVQNRSGLQNPLPPSVLTLPTPHTWTHPERFDDISPPPFPIDSLPIILKNYSLGLSEALQTPIDMASVAVISTCALCLQGWLKVEARPGWVEPTNLYSVTIAAPGEKKSPIQKACIKPILDYEIRDYESKKIAIGQSQTKKKVLQKEVDALINIVAKDPSQEPALLAKQDELTNFVEVKAFRITAGDITPESLGSKMAENNGQMGIISTEGGLFETVQGRYSGSVNIDLLLQAYSGDPVRIDRRDREEMIHDPRLTIMLAIQPQILEGIMTNNVLRGRGLTARFLYSLPKSNVGNRNTKNPQPIPQNVADDYYNLISYLLHMMQIYKQHPSIILTLSSDAASLFTDYAGFIERELVESMEAISDWGGKLCGTVLRLAGIFHAVNTMCMNLLQNPIPRVTMESAIILGHYFVEHAKLAHQLMGSDKKLQDAKFILRQLEKYPVYEFNRKYDIHRLCRSRIKDVDGMMPGLQVLEEFGYIKMFTVPNAKSFKVFLNPLHFNI